MDIDRDNNTITHFRARSKQPKLLSFAPMDHNVPPSYPNSTMDSCFGTASDEMDATRFRYTGTGMPHQENLAGRRLGHSCMRHGWNK